MTEQVLIFFQIVFIDLVLAGDNAIIIGMVASQFPLDQRKKNNLLGNWCSSYFKNIIYINYSLFTSNYRYSINRRFATFIYLLQVICRCSSKPI